MRSQHSKKTLSSKKKYAPNPQLNGSLNPRIYIPAVPMKTIRQKKKASEAGVKLFKNMLIKSCKVAQGEDLYLRPGQKNYLSFPKFSAFYLCSLDLRGKNDLVIQRRLTFLAKRSREGRNGGAEEGQGNQYFLCTYYGSDTVLSALNTLCQHNNPWRQAWLSSFYRAGNRVKPSLTQFK